MFSSNTYVERRTRLADTVGSGLIILPGANEMPINFEANCHRFRQDSSFLYYFGLQRPGLMAVIDVDAGTSAIYGNDVDLESVIWTGPLPLLEHQARMAGIETTADLAAFDALVAEARNKKRPIHILPPYQPGTRLALSRLLACSPDGVNSFVSEELIKAVVAMRLIKDNEELICIEEAVDAAWAMHTAVMMECAMGKPGTTERSLAEVLHREAAMHRCHFSFSPIVSTDGQILHSTPRDLELHPEKLLVVDSGAETFAGYSSDITRTMPVNGIFDQKQRDIYEIVLKANENSIAVSKPGVSYLDVHLQAAKIITEGLIDLGLMKGDPDEAVAAGAHAMFYPHGLGHAMGLDAHDMEDLGEDYVGYGPNFTRSDQFGLGNLRFARTLEHGHVVTVEPGIYFIPMLIERWAAEGKLEQFIAYENLALFRDFGGVRIEDNIVITENGCRVLGNRIPKTVSEIERAMSY